MSVSVIDNLPLQGSPGDRQMKILRVVKKIS
jgi:hypothetical protein